MGAGKGTISVNFELAPFLEQRQRRRMVQVHVLDHGVEIGVREGTTQTSVDDNLLATERASAIEIALSASIVEVGEEAALEVLMSRTSAIEDARDVEARYANAINLVVGVFVSCSRASVTCFARGVV